VLARARARGDTSRSSRLCNSATRLTLLTPDLCLADCGIYIPVTNERLSSIEQRSRSAPFTPCRSFRSLSRALSVRPRDNADDNTADI